MQKVELEGHIPFSHQILIFANLLFKSNKNNLSELESFRNKIEHLLNQKALFHMKIERFCETVRIIFSSTKV